jgi:GGDEF domain-containing protein
LRIQLECGRDVRLAQELLDGLGIDFHFYQSRSYGMAEVVNQNALSVPRGERLLSPPRDEDTFERESRRQVTFSIGAATFLDLPDSLDLIIRMADETMHAIKAHGKDNVSVALVG